MGQALRAARPRLQLRSTDGRTLPQLLLPLLAFEHRSLTALVLGMLTMHLERASSTLELGRSLLLLHAPASIAVHAKASALLELFHGMLRARPPAIDGAPAWMGALGSLLTQLHGVITEHDRHHDGPQTPTALSASPVAAAHAAVAETMSTAEPVAEPAAGRSPPPPSADRAAVALRRDESGRAQVLRVLWALQIHTPVIELLHLLPATASRDAAGAAIRHLVGLSCRILTPLAAGGGEEAAQLFGAIAPLARHAECPEALQCLVALFDGHLPLCAACPPSALRLLLSLPLGHGHRAELLVPIRRLVRQGGVVVARARALLLATLRSMPPSELRALFPAFATPSDGADGHGHGAPPSDAWRPFRRAPPPTQIKRPPHAPAAAFPAPQRGRGRQPIGVPTVSLRPSW